MLGTGPTSPDYAMALAKVQHMDKDELEGLLNDESKFDDYIKSLDQIRQLYQKKEDQMMQNKSLATFNLSQEPVLKAKKESLAAKHREAVALVQQLKESKAKLEAKTGSYEPSVLHDLLRIACSEAEQQSEQIAEDFLSNKIESVDEFVETFMEKRKLYHMRNVKKNKLEEIQAAEAAGGSTSSPNRTPVRVAPPPPPPANYAAGRYQQQQRNVPYSVTSPVAAQPPPPQAAYGAYPGGGAGPPSGAALPYPLNPGAGMPMGPPSYR